jgi:hypothetical protein
MKSSRKKTSSELLFKIIVIGESATGKSCLMVRYIKDDFNPEYSVTVGNLVAKRRSRVRLEGGQNRRYLFDQAADLGHGWAGELPIDRPQLLQEYIGGVSRV